VAPRLQAVEREPTDESSAGAAAPVPLPAPDLEAPPVIPEYAVLRRIGRGAYGDVWLARNVLGELRAVKVIYRRRFADPRPFEREFEGIQRFEPISRSHPSQLAILQVGKNDEAAWFYYVMELADDAAERSNGVMESPRNGQRPLAQTSGTPPPQHSNSYTPHTLRHDLDQHRHLRIADCVQIGLSLTTALAHLHQHGLVHRDIKPSNVIFVNGVPKLGDIGLVTEAGDTQSIVGTEGYLPPEGPGTPRADIFGLGKVLYEISTGLDRCRFPELPEDLRDWPDRKQVVEFNEILLKACAKDPAKRYASADEMRAELALLQRGKSVKRKRTVQALWAVGWKAGVASVVLVLAGLATLVLLPSGTRGHIQSPIAEVNRRVTQGALCNWSGRVSEAIKYYNQALDCDPKFAPAWFGLFGVYMSQGASDRTASAELRQDLRTAADRVREFAPRSSAEAHLVRGIIKWIDVGRRQHGERGHDTGHRAFDIGDDHGVTGVVQRGHVGEVEKGVGSVGERQRRSIREVPPLERERRGTVDSHRERGRSAGQVGDA
jgi:hypothetical protein